MKKSVAVIGLGKFGMSLAKALFDMGADVMAVDRNEERVKKVSGYCTEAVCIDVLREEEIVALDLKSMDIVVSATSRNLAASIMAVAVAKEQKVPYVIAKSSSVRMSSILKRIGADKVIIPEEESGVHSARLLLSDTFLDYFQVDDNLCMIEMKPYLEWIGHSSIELNLRKKYNINIVAGQKSTGAKWELLDPMEKLGPECRLLIILEKSQLSKMTNRR